MFSNMCVFGVRIATCGWRRIGSSTVGTITAIMHVMKCVSLLLLDGRVLVGGRLSLTVTAGRAVRWLTVKGDRGRWSARWRWNSWRAVPFRKARQGLGQWALDHIRVAVDRVHPGGGVTRRVCDHIRWRVALHLILVALGKVKRFLCETDGRRSALWWQVRFSLWLREKGWRRGGRRGRRSGRGSRRGRWIMVMVVASDRISILNKRGIAHDCDIVGHGVLNGLVTVVQLEATPQLTDDLGDDEIARARRQNPHREYAVVLEILECELADELLLLLHVNVLELVGIFLCAQ